MKSKEAILLMDTGTTVVNLDYIGEGTQV